jgi:LPXTG-motif cell wall-anchored protein
VFLDSSQPNAVINEKNELDKWDVPVNPDGETKPGTPDHGEPEGGKNIVVQEDPAYYADWSEAEIGESVHYQLRVNAVNFIRTGTTDDTVQQVKEYFLADYQSGHMTFDESKGLKVTVWAGSDGNDSQATDKANVTKDADGNTVTELDYTDKSSTFFKNTTNKDAESKPTDIFGEGTGIMVPWVKVVKGTDADPDSSFPIYTITNVPAVDGEGNPVYKTEEAKMEDGNKVPAPDENGAVIDGQFVSVNGNIINADGQLIGEDNQPIQDTDAYYVYSLYNSDVTIVVDYWMILNDDAIVDEPGNKNYAQYAWSPVDNKDNRGKPKQPGTPKNDDKPSQKEEVDEATVYTFALAWVKVDDKANELAGAKFKLPFYVKATKDNDGAYVYGGTKAGEGLTNEVTTTAESAVITIKGVEQGTYSIEETEAPVGYNKLTAPFDVEAKKSGDGVTTKTKTTIYLDADGNVTDTTTETTVEKATDKDSNVDNVPVYQFDPIVNKQGNELPATGGIGTTIFTVGGSLLALAAAILLVTKRRMNNND